MAFMAEPLDYTAALTEDGLVGEVAQGAFAFKNKIRIASIKLLWEKLSLFVATTLRSQKGVLLPNLGNFRVGPVVGETKKKIRPVFQLLEGRYGAVSQERSKYVVGGRCPIVQPNFGLLSTVSGVHRGACQRLVAELLQRLGVHILSGRPFRVKMPGLGRMVTSRAGRFEFAFDPLFMEYFEREHYGLIKEMPLAPEDYKVDKALQGVNLDDPPYVRSSAQQRAPSPSPSRRDKLLQEKHAPYQGSMLDLYKLCRQADRINSGCVPRLRLEEWLHRECRDVLAYVDAATLMDLLDSQTQGKTSKQIYYKRFLDALEMTLQPSGGAQAQPVAARRGAPARGQQYSDQGQQYGNEGQYNGQAMGQYGGGAHDQGQAAYDYVQQQGGAYDDGQQQGGAYEYDQQQQQQQHQGGAYDYGQQQQQQQHGGQEGYGQQYGQQYEQQYEGEEDRSAYGDQRAYGEASAHDLVMQQAKPQIVPPRLQIPQPAAPTPYGQQQQQWAQQRQGAWMPPQPSPAPSDYAHYNQNDLSPRSRSQYDDFNRMHFERLQSSRSKREVTPKVGEERLNVAEYRAVRSATPRHSRPHSPDRAGPPPSSQGAGRATPGGGRFMAWGDAAPAAGPPPSSAYPTPMGQPGGRGMTPSGLPPSSASGPRAQYVVMRGDSSNAQGLHYMRDELSPSRRAATPPPSAGYNILAPPPMPPPSAPPQASTPPSMYDINTEHDPRVKARKRAELAQYLRGTWDKQIEEKHGVEETLEAAQGEWPFAPVHHPNDKRPMSAISQPPMPGHTPGRAWQ